MPETMPLTFPAGKPEFDLEEAAAALGISASELRDLVAERLNDGEGVHELTGLRFRPADLIMLSWMHAGPAVVEAE